MRAYWKRWALLATAFLPLFGGSCATDLRDAVYGGALDFVSGSMTELLAALLPIVQVLTGLAEA